MYDLAYFSFIKRLLGFPLVCFHLLILPPKIFVDNLKSSLTHIQRSGGWLLCNWKLLPRPLLDMYIIGKILIYSQFFASCPFIHISLRSPLNYDIHLLSRFPKNSTLSSSSSAALFFFVNFRDFRASSSSMSLFSVSSFPTTFLSSFRPPGIAHEFAFPPSFHFFLFFLLLFLYHPHHSLFKIL